jgi:hypothetical protein
MVTRGSIEHPADGGWTVVSIKNEWSTVLDV